MSAWCLVGDVITWFSNISPQTSILNSVPDIWHSFLVGDVIHCPILQYFPIIIHAQSIAQCLLFIFSLQHNSLPDFAIFHLHAESSAWYLIYIFCRRHNSITLFTNISPYISTWPRLNPAPNICYTLLACNIISFPNLPILHQKSPHDHCWIQCPIFDMHFLAGNIITLPHLPLSPQQSPHAQCHIYSPIFPISWRVT
jgi:hypothetical protein